MFRHLYVPALILLSMTKADATENTCPDLTLVLAIDSSSSISASEFALEMDGYGEAFRNPAILRALSDAGSVDVAVVFWAGALRSTYIMPWTRIDSDADALGVATWFLTTTRAIHGDTEIGNGLGSALDLMDAHESCGRRRVVDVSGDGRGAFGSSRGPTRLTLKAATGRADSMGVTVNGLAIANEEPDLGQYYREEVITGTGSFAMEVRGFNDFAAAILEKLKREIRPRIMASITAG